MHNKKLIPILNQNTAFGLILAVFVIAAFSILGLTGVSLLQRTDPYLYLGQLNNLKAYYLSTAAKNYAYENYLQFRYNFTGITDPTLVTRKICTDFTCTTSNGTFTLALSNLAQRSISMTFQGATPVGTSTNYYQTSQNFSMNGDFSLAKTNLFSDFQSYAIYLNSQANFSIAGNWISIPAECISTRIYGDIGINCPSTATVTLKDNCGSCAWTVQAQIGPRATSPQPNIYTKCNLSVTSSSGDPLAVYGQAYAGGSINVTNATELPLANRHPNNSGCNNWPNNRCPTFPAIATAYFDSLIATATTKGINPATYTWTNPTNLSGANLFFNGNVTIPASYVINGPGAIIANGTIQVRELAQVKEGVSLIANGTITINGECYLGPSTPASYTVVGGNWDSTNKIIEGKGAIIYSQPGVQVRYYDESQCGHGGCCAAQDVAIKGSVLVSNTGPSIWSINKYTFLFGILYEPNSEGFFSLANSLYGNLFVGGITDMGAGYECKTFRDVYPYKDIPYPGGSREEIPLEVKGLYSIPRTPLTVSSISF